ncbi:Kazal-like serine protease inhibitor [Phytophthora megakarya]|uniref:Kazal-like serine protease inhibitor n=1 Tax=Phytophthora megakarya TaxID=4795 RepID=A0A225VXS0_9STRA|nr:Kazal-like serine protease inhibitor [Phytophthora megakarya]
MLGTSDADGSSTGAITSDVCEQKCTNENKPVCGTNGVTYGNLCKLQIAGCNSTKIIWKKSDGPCPQ